MDQDLSQRLNQLEQKIEQVHRSAEQTRKYILWSVIIGIALFVLPLIGLMLVIPKYIQMLNVGGLLE